MERVRAGARRIPPVDTLSSHLGIDAGGSKTDWVLIAGETVAGSGSAGGIQVALLGVERAAERLAAVVHTATTAADVAGAVAGIAGAGTPEIRAGLLRALRGRGITMPFAIAVDDVLAAAAALRGGPGVALWSGTGSFAVARDRAGRLHRVGGRGWLLGDEGSAFAMARRAAAAVVAAADGLGPVTALADALLAAAKVRDAFTLARTLQAWSPGEVAALYPCVRAAARAGDAVAVHVRREGVDALVRLALAAARRAGLPHEEAETWLGGGVLARDPDFADMVHSALLAAGVPVMGPSPRSAARGAADLAAARAAGTSPLSGWLSGDDPT